MQRRLYDTKILRNMGRFRALSEHRGFYQQKNIYVQDENKARTKVSFIRNYALYINDKSEAGTNERFHRLKKIILFPNHESWCKIWIPDLRRDIQIPITSSGSVKGPLILTLKCRFKYCVFTNVKHLYRFWFLSRVFFLFMGRQPKSKKKKFEKLKRSIRILKKETHFQFILFETRERILNMQFQKHKLEKLTFRRVRHMRQSASIYKIFLKSFF